MQLVIQLSRCMDNRQIVHASCVCQTLFMTVHYVSIPPSIYYCYVSLFLSLSLDYSISSINQIHVSLYGHSTILFGIFLVNLSIHLFVHLLVHLSICLFPHLSTDSVHLLYILFVNGQMIDIYIISMSISVYIHIYLSSVCLSVYPSIYINGWMDWVQNDGWI